MNSDFKDLLKILNENDVQFLVIGGYAVMHYTEPRYTKDLDILLARTPENAEKVLKALREFGAPLFDLKKADLTDEGVFYQIGIAPNRVDLITSIPGVVFSEAYKEREIVQLGDVKIPFMSKKDLIRSKLAAGRPQDLVDAGALAKRDEA